MRKFNVLQLGYLCEACAKQAASVRRMAESGRYDDETRVNLAKKADALEDLRQYFAVELAAANEALTDAVQKLAGRRCHWCERWVPRGVEHECRRHK